MNTEQAITEVCDHFKDFLIGKNRKYGDSALNPLRILSKADALEQLNVRIDDKLSRIMNQQEDDDEDAEEDLIGYLLLKRAKKLIDSRFVEPTLDDMEGVIWFMPGPSNTIYVDDNITTFKESKSFKFHVDDVRYQYEEGN